MIEQHVAEDAVSPVIGVMLMLVVTIIIAAVVSAFSGGMMKSEQTAPQASFECVISNDGTWGGSSFSLTCLAARHPYKRSEIGDQLESIRRHHRRGNDHRAFDRAEHTLQECYRHPREHIPLTAGIRSRC